MRDDRVVGIDRAVRADVAADVLRRRPPVGHGHLWCLADGTGLHAPPGELVRDVDTGRVCCHLCGRWFVALGAHVRVHGYTADGYRAELGLCSSRALAGADLSTQLRRRQRAAYVGNAEIREHLGLGQAMALSGELAWRRRVTAVSRPEPAQRVRERAENLATGRVTQEAARRRRLADRLAALGAADLPSYLRAQYTAGASLETLRAATGLGREQLRRALADAGVQVRLPGVNRPAGKQARAYAADVRAAERLGVADLHGWLLERYGEGWTLQRLGRAVGHSNHWVKWRLVTAASRLAMLSGGTASAG